MKEVDRRTGSLEGRDRMSVLPDRRKRRQQTAAGSRHHRPSDSPEAMRHECEGPPPLAEILDPPLLNSYKTEFLWCTTCRRQHSRSDGRFIPLSLSRQHVGVYIDSNLSRDCFVLVQHVATAAKYQVSGDRFRQPFSSHSSLRLFSSSSSSSSELSSKFLCGLNNTVTARYTVIC